MDRLFLSYLCLLTIILCCQIDFGGALRVEINPPQTNNIFPTEIHLSCRLDDDHHCQVKEIIVVEMLYQNVRPIAILRQNSELSIGKGLERDFSAEGFISKNVSESYLHVTLTKPRKEDSGVYSCAVFHLNEMGILNEMRANASLEVTNVDVTTVLQEMMEKISRLEIDLIEEKNKSKVTETMLKKRVALLEAKVEEQEAESMKNIHLMEEELKELKNDSTFMDSKLKHVMAHRVTQKQMMSELGKIKSKIGEKEKEIMEKVSSLEKQLENQIEHSLTAENSINNYMGSLETKIIEHDKHFTNQTNTLQLQLKEQGISLKQLNETESFSVAFSAGYTKTIKLFKGNAMIFDDVMTNVGQGYNKSSGIFTAPRAGYYYFQLSMTIRSVNWIDVELRNKGKALGRIVVGDRSWDDQSSTSVVTRLEAGETVVPIVFSIGSTYAPNSLLLHSYTTFSGYLLKEV